MPKKPGIITKSIKGRRKAVKRITPPVVWERIETKSFRAAPIGDTEDELIALRSLV